MLNFSLEMLVIVLISKVKKKKSLVHSKQQILAFFFCDLNLMKFFFKIEMLVLGVHIYNNASLLVYIAE